MKTIKSKIIFLAVIMAFSLAAAFTIMLCTADCFAKAAANREQSWILPGDASLFMEFDNALDAAVGNDYYVIAESGRLHIFDLNAEKYHKVDFTGTSIEKVYVNSNYIYFNSDLKIYRCPVSGGKDSFAASDFAEIPSAQGNTFAVDGNFIAAATNKKITVYDQSYSAINTVSLPAGNVLIPHISLSASNLSYTLDGGVNAIAYDGAGVYYVNASGLFKQGESGMLCAGDFKSVKYFKGLLYLCQKNKITAYSIAEKRLTSFEISASSSSNGRLNNAEDICGFNDNLYIADTQNHRMTVLQKSGTFLANVDISPLEYPFLVAANAKSALLITSDRASFTGDSHVYLINLSDYSYQKISGSNPLFTGKTIISAAAGGHSFYLLTDKHATQEVIIIGENGDISKKEFSGSHSSNLPLLLSCDINGNLFVLFADGTLNKYAKDTLYSGGNLGAGEVIAQFNLSARTPKKLFIDIKQSAFVATTASDGTDGKIHKYSGAAETIEAVSPLTSGELLKSFTAYSDEQSLYYLFSNTVKKDNIAPADHLKSIDIPPFTLAGGLELIHIKKGLNLLIFDYEKLEGESYFPVEGYIENAEDLVAVKLFETNEYIVFTGKYTGLVAKDVNVVPYGDEALYKQVLSLNGYANSRLNVYKYPVLDTNFIIGGLEQFSGIAVKARISHADLSTDFYLIDINGGAGYIPLSAFTENVIQSAPEGTFTLRTLKSGNIDVFSDENLSVIAHTVGGGVNVKVIDKTSSYAYIEYEKDGQLINGYISASSLATKGSDTARNVGIILLIALAATITALYLVKRKSN